MSAEVDAPAHRNSLDGGRQAEKRPRPCDTQKLLSQPPPVRYHALAGVRDTIAWSVRLTGSHGLEDCESDSSIGPGPTISQ